MTLLENVARAHDALTRLGAILSAVSLGGIVVFYCWEILTRFFLGHPTSWTAAVSVYLLLSTVMLMLPLLTMGDDHVAVSIAEERFSPGIALASRRVVLVIAVVICALSTWFVGSEAWRALSRGVQTTDTLAIPKWWLIGTIVYGLGSSTLHFLRKLLDRKARRDHVGTDAA